MTAPPATPSLLTGNLRGMAWMVLSTVFFTVMQAAVRHVSAEVHAFEVAFFRSVCGLLVILPWFLRYGLKPLRTERLGLHAMRAFCYTVSVLTLFLALGMMPFAEVTAIAFSAPLIGTLLCMILLKEAVRPGRWLTILFGLAGAIVILRPGFAVFGAGQALMIVVVLFWGASLVCLKALGRTESSITATSYAILLTGVMCLPPALLVWTWPTGDQWIWLIAIGVLGALAQLTLAQALREADANVAMPLDFFRLIWAALIGFLVFAEVPDAFTWIGGAMIFASATWIAWRENEVRRSTLGVQPVAPTTDGTRK